MTLHFTKMHGLGNDFMVIDGIHQSPVLTPERIRQWADRHFGIGFDQLLIVEPPTTPNALFTYRIFNADGSEVGQCGNGARCFARFVLDKGLTTERDIPVDTKSGLITLHVTDDGNVTVDMGAPITEPSRIPFIADEASTAYRIALPTPIAGQTEVIVDALSMGNPHAVIDVTDVDRAPVDLLGSAIERHARFPERVNVGFMSIVDRHTIRLRVFERGAGETLACGTGACAAVVSGIRRGLLDSPCQVDLPGGSLSIAWAGATDAPVLMTGPAQTVFEGTLTE
ncbi:diaminopimelate epimerase [Halothiobacillus diazotrophicus]|uniref:Diaminopimelate epimerase n=1 Tax=Halothiobacillus diazotrophicus TaxID=1860122 RepID=A0A191ZJC9_9GAMM|nr:diaminopimelate epimerase [Halothiobacillus diazotrophicus]ANJ67948.1 diaminopimelate epimerase [Halothiobacillus diazotrophicus]